MESEGIKLDNVGDTAELVLVDPWPKHRRLAPLVFEVLSKKGLYDEMLKEMDQFYADLRHRERLTDENIEVEMVVIYVQKIGKREGYTFKRAKIIKEIKSKVGTGSEKKAQSKAGSGSDQAQSKVGAVSERAKSIDGTASDKAQSKAGAVSERAKSIDGTASDKAQSKVGAVSKSAKSMDETASDKAQSKAGAVSERAKSIAGIVSEKAQPSAGTGSDRAQSKTGTVSDKRELTMSKVEIDLIDYGVTLEVFTYELQLIEGYFAVLPPRASALEPKLGLENYRDTGVYKRLINRNSGLFNGTLNVQRLHEFSETLVVYSPVCPISTHPYGINGYIMKRFASESSEHKLPPINEEKKNAHITYALSTGKVYVRFRSKFHSHYFKIMKQCLLQESYRANKDKVRLPIRPSQILLALHKNTAVFARCICIEQKQTLENTIKVQFIDHGDIDCIKISDILYARDINILLELIPPLAYAAQLYGVTSLDVPKISKCLTVKKSWTVKTRHILPCGTHEISIVNYETVNEKLYRETVLCEEMGESACEEDRKLELEQAKSDIFHETPYCTIAMDLLDSNGDGSECLFYPKHTEVDLAVCGWEEDETVLAHPTSMRERLVLLERQLNKVYSCSWNSVSSSDSVDGKYFAVVAPAYHRVVRCKVVGPIKDRLDEVEVLLVDYGTTIGVLKENLRRIEYDHTVVPALGCNVSLFEKESGHPIRRMENFRTRMKVDHFRGIVSDVGYKKNGVLQLGVTFIESFGRNLDYKVAWDEW